MDKLNCPHCNGEVLNDARLAGQVVACPNCQNPFRMPTPSNPGDSFTFEQTAATLTPPPTTSAAPPQKQPPQKKPIAKRQAAPRAQPHQPPPEQHLPPLSSPPPQSTPNVQEPWCYRFLEGYAKVLLWLGIVQVTICLGLLIFLTVLRLQNGEILSALAVLIAGFFVLLVMLFGYFFFVAFIHLSVDMGRNLRAIREQSEGV